MYTKKLLHFESFICDECRDYTYAEDMGDPEHKIKSFTLVENLPEDWRCPKCGASKDKLLPILALGSTAW